MGIRLFSGVGSNLGVEHVAIQTAFGQLVRAKILFWKLGYAVSSTRKARGVWGKSILMVKEGSASIQLTDSLDSTPVPLNGNHVAIRVEDPKSVALEIQKWSRAEGLLAGIEEIPKGKYFVVIPGILSIPIELVPMTISVEGSLGFD